MRDNLPHTIIYYLKTVKVKGGNMIYLDNAATGGYKPNCVIDKTVSVIKYLNANAGRSGHRLSKTGLEFIYSARKTVSDFFNNNSVEKVIFTKNCSEALNTAILGTLKVGGHIITTVFEHNSVLRPLYSLKEKGVITLTVVSPENGKNITASDIEKAITPNTYLVIVNNISNVTGTVNDIENIGLYLKDKNILFMVDGAQSAGHINIDMNKFAINILCVAGHKGLYGIAGSGALIIDEKTDISPTFCGGTGTETFNLSAPTNYPEKLEYGTLNLPAICSLDEGIRYIGNNLDFISKQLSLSSEFVIDKLSKINGVKTYSTPNPAGIVAFSVKDNSSIEVAEILSDNFNIAVRGGFHCAPLVHKFLNTEEDGLVRASICLNNTKRELNALIDAVKYITSF